MIMKSIIIGLTSLVFVLSGNLFAALPKDVSGAVYHKEWLWSAVEKAKADAKASDQSQIAIFPPTNPSVTIFPPTGPSVTMFPPSHKPV
jgi:hypothetical protein